MIKYNLAKLVGDETEFIQQVLHSGHLSGNGPFTKKCEEYLEMTVKCQKAFIVHSCTAALEMAAISLDLKYGDEVIMPSYTFVSTANSVALRGAVPVFVDIRPDTLNIDENLIENAISERTKAIFVVHYAGVSCEMDSIMAIAKKYSLAVVEDAAQAMCSYYKGRHLGSIGDFAAISFHETKNVISGEGGAFFVNFKNKAAQKKAEFIREKGTNRSDYIGGNVSKYVWQELGSSYLPSELISAFLFAQLNAAQKITAQRLANWQVYHEALSMNMKKACSGSIPDECKSNGHIYYLTTTTASYCKKVIDELAKNGIQATRHYVPLHDSPAGQKYGRTSGKLSVTESVHNRILRLPTHVSMSESEQSKIIDIVINTLG